MVKDFLKNNYKIIIILVFILIIVLTLIFANTKNKTVLQEISKIDYNYFIYISNEDMVGVVDKNGKLIIEANYSNIYIPNPSKDVFMCYETEDEYEFINSKGEKLFSDYDSVNVLKTSESDRDFEKDVLKYKKSDKYGLIDYSGNKITEAEYDSIQSLKNRPGELLVKKSGKYGVLKVNGELKLEIKYDGISGDEFYSEKYGYGQTGYIISEKTDEGIMYGYIDYNGEQYLETKYESLSRVFEYTGEDVYLIVMQNGKKGIYKNDKLIIDQKYQSIAYSKESNLFAVKRNSKYGIFNTDGKQILEVKYTAYNFAGDYISVELNEKKELYDINGNKVSNLKYESVEGTEIEGCYIVKDENGLYSIITRDDVIEGKYTYISYAFNNNFIFKDEKGYYGILDLYAGVIVEPEYSFMLVIDGASAIEAVSQTGEVDIYSDNIEKIATIQDAIIENIGDNYVVVYSMQDRVYIDKTGNIVTSEEALGNKKLYAYKENGKWGYKDSSGNVVVDAEYEMTTELNPYGFAGIYQDGMWGVINQDGNIIVEPTYEIETYYYPEFIGKYLLLLGDSYYCQELE